MDRYEKREKDSALLALLLQQEPHPETTEVTTDHGLSTVQEDEIEDAFAQGKAKGSPAYVTNTVLAESCHSDYDAREAREDGLLGNPSFQTQEREQNFQAIKDQFHHPFHCPGFLVTPVLQAGRDFPSWMTEDQWPSYSDKDVAGAPGVYPPMAMPPFPMVPPLGANSQSLAQYSASLQAIADQYSKQASMVASMAREGDLGLGMPCGGLNPWVLPDPAAAGYGMKGGNERPRTDRFAWNRLEYFRYSKKMCCNFAQP
eukprot:s3630_g2.t1